MRRPAEVEEGPHPLDIALGARVRLRRKQLGMSQQDLAQGCGITFQQVQKYEHGTNRISFSRLVEIARALQSSVLDLIGDLDSSKSSNAFSRQIAHLAAPGANDLLHAYNTISSPKQRQALLSMARQLATEAKESDNSHKRRRAALRRAR